MAVAQDSSLAQELQPKKKKKEITDFKSHKFMKWTKSLKNMVIKKENGTRQSRNKANEEPGGCGFDPWPHSVG